MISSDQCWLKNNCKKLHCNNQEGCLILFKLDYLYNEANIPLNLRAYMPLRVDSDGTDLEQFKRLKAIQDNIVDFVNEGRQLYIYSSQAGNGKTSWSLRLLQSYFNKIWLKSALTCRGLFINVPYFLLALKDNISNKSEYIQHIKDNVEKCDIVIWDDISNKAGTEFEISHLLSMINSRIMNGKTNIYTSNINPEKLQDYLDIRLASRIATNSEKIQFNGGDKRGLTLDD